MASPAKPSKIKTTVTKTTTKKKAAVKKSAGQPPAGPGRCPATCGRSRPPAPPPLPRRHLFAGLPHAVGTARGDHPLRPVYGRAGESRHQRPVPQISLGRGLCASPAAELEKDIQSTGFFRNKAKSIQNCCRLLVEQYDGQVPQDIEQLVELPGIGRKTANVILGTAFGIASGVVVDTHVTRLSHRLGLSRQKDAEKIEKDLMEVIPARNGSPSATA